mmetsp:Transcript_8905/g.12385  ORF Transcript_8905/g.12385 Transcript_8905/m.12385 type:complete len:82 (-) Transcript_8905:81-326(-)
MFVSLNQNMMPRPGLLRTLLSLLMILIVVVVPREEDSALFVLQVLCCRLPDTEPLSLSMTKEDEGSIWPSVGLLTAKKINK